MDFGSVRTEEEDALRRYNRQRNLKTFVGIATLFSLLVLLFFAWSSPRAMDIAGDVFRTLKSILGQRHYVFILLNTLVLAIWLSNRKNADVARRHLYDEDVSKAAPAANHHFPALEMKIEVVNRNSDCPVKKIGTETISAVVVAKECSIKRRYGRNQSESFDRGRAAVRELRRSETENGRETVVGRGAMDKLSSEEFRRRVESFIATGIRRKQTHAHTDSYSAVGEPR